MMMLQNVYRHIDISIYNNKKRKIEYNPPQYFSLINNG